MKINKLIASVLVCGMLVGAVSCTSHFEDYNTDYSGATDEEIDVDGYLINSTLDGMSNYVIPTDANMNQFVECLMGGSFGGYMADSNDGFNGKNYATYTPEEHWVQVAFNDIIPAVFIRHSDIRRSTKNPVPIAVSDILKVLAMSRVTDIYGPIPYSRVGEGGKLNAPYDSQEDVYKKMFEELDGAIDVLTAHRTGSFNPKGDNVYNGNVEKWVKLGNSIKLRLALRIANVSPALAQSKAVEAATHEIGAIVSNDDNAVKLAPGKNPFRIVMYDYNGGDSRVSADITSYMNGYKDPRREKYFTPTTFTTPGIVNDFNGLRSGIQIPAGGIARLYSNMVVAEDSKVLWISAAEVAFLKAEGALRGWNMGSPAESGATPAEGFYNTGIKLSFAQWGASGADLYMVDAVSKPAVYRDPAGSNSFTGTTSDITIKWDATASQEKNIERIITQKWIANFPQGVEAWSEYRRTGYPKLMSVTRNNSGGKVDSERMARRLPYPQEEYTENTENLQIAISQYLKGADNMGADVWWAKKN